MATTTLTRYLRLKVSPDLSADASYNLNRIDSLAQSFNVDTNSDLNLRSRNEVSILPHDASSGGSGTGGTVNFGSASQNLTAVNAYADTLFVKGTLSLFDQATSGTKSLFLRYVSNLNGSIDTAANRIISIDTEGDSRLFILGGNLALYGANLTFSLSGNSVLTVPGTGTLVTTTETQTLTNKTIDGLSNTITNVSGSNISLNSIAYNKLILTDSIVNADINSAAAIAGSKIAPQFGNQIVSTSGRLRSIGSTYYTDIFPAASGQTANISLYLPPTAGSANQLLQTDGSGNTSWVTAASSNLSQNRIDVGNASNQRTETNTSSLGDVLADTTTGLTIKSGAIVNAQVSASAAIAVSKLAAGTNGQFLRTTAGVPTWSSILSTDLSDFNEAAQDAVGGALMDTASINLTYNDGSNLISADVLPAGVDHDSLLNYVANQHIDHTSVQIATSSTSGLSGGGTIAATRNIVVAPDQATSKASPVDADLVLIGDSADSFGVKKSTLSSILFKDSYVTNWTSGTTFNAAHNLGTRDVQVEIYDNTTFETVLVDSVIRTTTNAVDFTASQAPSGAGLRILIRRVN